MKAGNVSDIITLAHKRFRFAPIPAHILGNAG